MIYLDKSSISFLKNHKNLLAFSAGVDSSALFFLLLENNVSFDIALVNYGLRKDANTEEQHAITLAKKHKINCYTANAPVFENNFEKNARDFRYAFFDKLMEEHRYDNLLTAHQLNDQLEWFLMRLTKGAGTSELLGLEALSKRKNYLMLRPLLHHAKDELQHYLNTNDYPYFIDESNNSEKYERNRFRKDFSNKLIENFKEGIKRSFDYLQEDKEILNSGFQEIFHHKELYILEYEHEHLIIRIVDQYLKKLGYLLSGQQRQELKKEKSIVFGGVWAVEIQKSKIFIAPFRTNSMPKAFKETCRILKVPSKIRVYIWEEQLTIKDLPV